MRKSIVAAAAVAIVAVIAAGAVLLSADSEDDASDGSVSLSAGFKASVSYSEDGATITATPSASGAHTWTIGSETVTSTGKNPVSVTVPISDSSCLISHTVTSGDTTRTMSVLIAVDGVKHITLSWTDGSGTDRSVSLELDWSTWNELRTRGDMGTLEDILSSDDPVIAEIAEQLNAMWSELDNDTLAAELLLFVQLALDYKDDFQTTGYADWYKTPYETVYDLGGDCEDSAMLFAMLGEALGLHTAIIEMDGHVAAAVWLEDPPEDGASMTTASGVTYCYCETATDDAIPIGVDLDDHLAGFLLMICLDDWTPPETEGERDQTSEDDEDGEAVAS